MWYLTPVSLYDMAAMEQWLERMAQKGRFLVDAGPLLSRFERGSPGPSAAGRSPWTPRAPSPPRNGWTTTSPAAGIICAP